MHIVNGKSFSGIHDIYTNWAFLNKSRCLANVIYTNCSFDNCLVSLTNNVRKKTLVKNVTLKNCVQKSCDVYAAVLDNIIVENLDCKSLLGLYGTLFKHVKFTGSIGNLIITPLVKSVMVNNRQNRIFLRLQENFYKNLDWALDITEAEFKGDITIRNIPVHLIRRDKSTQMIARKNVLNAHPNLQFELTNSPWRWQIEDFLDRDYPEIVLIAPKKSKHFLELTEALLVLKAKGLVNED